MTWFRGSLKTLCAQFLNFTPAFNRKRKVFFSRIYQKPALPKSTVEELFFLHNRNNSHNTRSGVPSNDSWWKLKRGKPRMRHPRDSLSHDSLYNHKLSSYQLNARSKQEKLSNFTSILFFGRSNVPPHNQLTPYNMNVSQKNRSTMSEGFISLISNVDPRSIYQL